MTGPGELTHAVLVKVAAFLRDLPPDQLRALADGEATLSVTAITVSATQPGKPAATPRTVKAALPIDPAELREQLGALTDRASAARFLDDLGLSAAQLRTLARELGLAVASSAAKAAVRDTIVQWTVGRRVDSAVLSRPRP